MIRLAQTSPRHSTHGPWGFQTELKTAVLARSVAPPPLLPGTRREHGSKGRKGQQDLVYRAVVSEALSAEREMKHSRGLSDSSLVGFQEQISG
ncbi:unnamed protein product [Arctogadus glacialis]